MKSILLLLSLTAICTAAELNQDGLRRLEQQSCGVAKESPGLIKGGDEVIPGSRPWMALIKSNVMGGKNDSYSCIGTLITDQFVLTAAHCVHGFDIESVRLGEHQLTKDVDCIKGKKTQCLPNIESFGVEQKIIHDKYTSPKSYPYDIALLKLNRKVVFNDLISPICLPINTTLEEQATSLETFLLTGWGHDRTHKPVNLLQEITVDSRAENRQICAERAVIDENLICILNTSNSLCRGISGAPYSSQVEYNGTKRFVQFALASAGRGCSPGVGVNTAKYMSWITKVIA